jgi:hypothetical protein
MIRNLTIVAVASFVLAVGCFTGAFALGGRDILQHGWNFPADWNVDDRRRPRPRQHHGHRSGSSTTTTARPTTRDIAWSGATPCRSTCRPT